MDTQSKTPVGAALFTRKTEQGSDYNWGYAQTGTFQLLNEAQKVFAIVLGADSIITDRTMFAVIQQGQRIGILVAHIPTSRRDFSGRPISTTLYLEFVASDKADVLNGAATLLNSSHQKNLSFLNYAEDLLKNPHGSPNPIQLPAFKTASSSEPVVKKKGLTFSPLNERDQHANYLTRLSDNFCFVSTGHVKQSQYQELENIFKGGLLILTSSQNTVESTRKKIMKIPYRCPVKKLTFSLAAMLWISLSAAGLMKYNEVAQQLSEQHQEIRKLHAESDQNNMKIKQLTDENRGKDVKISELKQQNEQIKNVQLVGNFFTECPSKMDNILKSIKSSFSNSDTKSSSRSEEKESAHPKQSINRNKKK